MTTEQTERPRRLTYEEYLAGEPCPGCGRPLRDEEPWEFKGTVHFADEERARYEDEEAVYKARHGDCHEVRWSIEGSLTMHCGKCCPPHPLSPSQIEGIARILATARRERQPSVKPEPVRELRRRTVEVYEDEWKRAKQIAAGRGDNIGKFIRDALATYIHRNTT